MIDAPVQQKTVTLSAAISNSGRTVQASITTSGIVVECPVYTGKKGDSGHSPVLTWSGDQIAVDGVVSGPHLTGPQGVQGLQGVPGNQGPAGDQRVFVQETQPDFNGQTGVWVQTGMTNNGFTIWFEDGE